MKHYILFCLCLLGFWLSAQQTKVSGNLIDTDGSPIAWVSVVEENSTNGTNSQEDGSFTLTVSQNIPTTLIFSAVGFQTVIKKINPKVANLQLGSILLAQNQEQLAEVVVEGHHNKYVQRTPSSSLRLQTEVAKLPQNIQIIGGELLKDQQVTNIMEGLSRNVSGVTLLEHWGNFARVNMRGFRLPAFRNGFNVQDTWGPLSEDMAFVDQVEFVKGPAGFMMAAGEPGGFYNVVTKKPTEQSIASVNIMAGSNDFYRGSFDFGGKLTTNGKLLYRLNAMYQSSDTHRGNETTTRYGVAPALTYNISDKTAVTAELNIQQAESLLGAAYVFAPLADGYGSLDRDFKFVDTNYPATDIQEVTLFTNIKHEFNENWVLEGKFGYLRYDQEGTSTWLLSLDDATGDAIRYNSIWDALSIGKFAQAYLNGTVYTGGVTHKILGGFDFTEREYWADFNQFGVVDVAQPFNIYNPEYGNSVLPDFNRSVAVKFRPNVYNYGFTNRSFYFQDEIGFIQDKIRLTLAGRYTNLATIGITENEEIFTPRAGLSIDILPSLTLYGLYDQAFTPNAGVSATGEQFDPVKGNDIEGGLKKRFFDGKLTTSLGAYVITKENVLTADPNNPNFSIQLGEIQSKGIEFDLQGEVTPEFNVVLNYANTNVEITEDSNPENIGNRVAGHAKHMTNGWLNYNFANDSKFKGFGASLGYQYQIDRSTWQWGADNESVLPDYFRLDGALSWQNNHFRVQLNINNLLDEYLYSGSAYSSYLYWQSEPGINGRLSVTYNF